MDDTESTTTAEDTTGCCGAAPTVDKTVESDGAAPEQETPESPKPAQMFGRCC